jgi:CRP/FNR family transcriptional regulator
LRAGDILFRSGEPQQWLVAVRAGSLKTCAVMPSGERRVLGFHLMADAVGLDALDRRVHGTEAIALRDGEVCRIPVEAAEALMTARPATARRMRRLLSAELAEAAERMKGLAGGTARQRVAAFLLDLGARWGRRGYSAREFDLCLTRKDMGSYLGLTFETVSRTLSHFNVRGWIALAGRQVEILDVPALEAERAGVARAPATV